MAASGTTHRAVEGRCWFPAVDTAAGRRSVRMSDTWSDADWDDDDWEESRAEVDAALTQIAPPSIEVEAADAERLRRLQALKVRSTSSGGEDSTAVPPPPVVETSCEPASAEQHALFESDGNLRVGEAASPPRVRAADGEDVQYKFYASGGRYEGALDPVTAQPHGFGVFYYPCGHRYEGPWEQGEKHGERGTFYCAYQLLASFGAHTLPLTVLPGCFGSRYLWRNSRERLKV